MSVVPAGILLTQQLAIYRAYDQGCHQVRSQLWGRGPAPPTVSRVSLAVCARTSSQQFSLSFINWLPYHRQLVPPRSTAWLLIYYSIAVTALLMAILLQYCYTYSNTFGHLSTARGIAILFRSIAVLLTRFSYNNIFCHDLIGLLGTYGNGGFSPSC